MEYVSELKITSTNDRSSSDENGSVSDASIRNQSTAVRIPLRTVCLTIEAR
jgi:hypothetical protein